MHNFILVKIYVYKNRSSKMFMIPAVPYIRAQSTVLFTSYCFDLKVMTQIGVLIYVMNNKKIYVILNH